MEKINRGRGTTASERFLAKLSDKTFLDLWSYPNTFNDRDMHKRQGKELCDLLVVCGRDVLIFSDKAITWPPGDDLGLAWKRWYKRAVAHSVTQIRGAERWLRKYPDRIFIDPACTIRLPVDLPSVDQMRVHGVAVVGGARSACARFFGETEGSLMISSSVRGETHMDTVAEGHLPFTVGDVDPEGSFVHVFDEVALPLVMSEMDTITDFVEYLLAREAAIRGGAVGLAASESELVAAYLLTEPKDGKRYIPSANDYAGDPHASMHFLPGGYQQLRNHPQYRAKKRADKDAKAWDKLIGLFTTNLLQGTSVSVLGQEPQVSLAERALRQMAREDRTHRRALGLAFADALREAELRGQYRFPRVILPMEGSADPECAYIFLILAFRGEWFDGKDYEYYREGRAGLLKAYCQVLLYQMRNLKRVVGIAIDASPRMTGKRGSSEDLLMMEILEWTPELEEETRTLQREAEILLPERLQPRGLRLQEFPDVSPGQPRTGNRKSRRAAKARRKADSRR